MNTIATAVPKKKVLAKNIMVNSINKYTICNNKFYHDYCQITVTNCLNNIFYLVVSKLL